MVQVKKMKQQKTTSLGTPRGSKSFLRRAQIFWIKSNGFKLCPAHFPGGLLPPACTLVTVLRET